MTGEAETQFPETVIWRGSVKPWECDQMEHLNTRFYHSIFAEALVSFAGQLGLEGAFRPGAEITVDVEHMHIRFLREARAGAQLRVTGGVVAAVDTNIDALFVMFHGSGEVAATFLARLKATAMPSGRPAHFLPPELARAEALRLDPPRVAAPRSLPFAGATQPGAVIDPAALGMMQIAVGAFDTRHCDAFGRMRVDQVLARVSDGVGLVLSPMRVLAREHAAVEVGRIGGAMLEKSIHYFDLPGIGERFEIWSALTSASEKVTEVTSLMIRPRSGEVFAMTRGVTANFDLDRRRIIPLKPEGLEKLGAFIRDLSGAGITSR